MQMQQIIEQKQMKDFMRLYSGLVERCFQGCVNDFTSRALTSKETQCVSYCTQKFLKHSERVGARFAEEKYVRMQETYTQRSSDGPTTAVIRVPSHAGRLLFDLGTHTQWYNVCHKMSLCPRM